MWPKISRSSRTRAAAQCVEHKSRRKIARVVRMRSVARVALVINLKKKKTVLFSQFNVYALLYGALIILLGAN